MPTSPREPSTAGGRLYYLEQYAESRAIDCAVVPTSSIWASTDYALDWPRELVRGELLALYEHPFRGWAPGEVERLLEEAFHTGVPAEDFHRNFQVELHLQEQWAGRSWIDALLQHFDELREHSEPAAYWPERHSKSGTGPDPTPADAPHRFASLIGRLRSGGYLDRDFSEPCVTQDPDEHFGRDLNIELGRRLTPPAQDKIWPLQPETWDGDTFYALVEIFHDLVTRPRAQWDCRDDHCGPHFHDFDTDAGRRVYRALINRMLDDTGVDVLLAIDGEDQGRLVHVVDGARNGLLKRALATPTPEVQERVEHAIALFRGRDATEQDKHSAVLALVGILEERRELISTQISSKDEDALFMVANQFAIRHQRRGQKGDYDPIFLDWIFWWYLATVELTDRLLARDTAPTAATTATS